MRRRRWRDSRVGALRAGWSGEDGTSAGRKVRTLAATQPRGFVEGIAENHTHKVLNAASWTSEQREMIEEVEKALHAEYKARREMVVNQKQVMSGRRFVTVRGCTRSRRCAKSSRERW